MDNLNISDECMGMMGAGIMKNVVDGAVLKILSLSGNLLTEKSLNPLYSVMTKGGLT